MLPYHKNALEMHVDDLFPWEGVANAVYSEHRRLHPKDRWIRNDPAARAFFTKYWLGDVTGIIQTMIYRAEHDDEWAYPDYQSPNQAAMGGYAPPQQSGPNENPEVYAEIYGVAFMVIMMDVSVGPKPWPYDGFAHKDTSAGVAGLDRAGFSHPWWAQKNYYVGPIPAIYK